MPPTRRTFLRSVVAGAAASGLSLPATGAVEENNSAAGAAPEGGPLPAVLKVSVAAYSYRRDMDKPGEKGTMSLIDLVRMAARWRIDAIEATSYYFFSTGDAYLHQLKREVFLAGLEISGTPVGNNFCFPPGEQRNEQVQLVKDWVDRCVKLGSPAIRIFAGKPLKETDRDTTFKYVVEAMKEASDYAASRGIFLSIENHGFLTERADDLLRLLDAVDNPWLGINLDTGNFHADPYGDMAKAAPRAVTCQVKTLVRAAAGGTEPADFARIIDILRAARYRGYVALEYEGDKPHEEVPMYLDRLKRLAAGK